MWELDHKESWAPKNWSFWTVVLEKTLEHPLDSKEIHPVNPRGNQPWIFTGRTDAEAEAPILWLPDVKTWLEKTLMLGKIEGRRRRGWQRMRWLDGIISLGDSEGQGGLAFYSPFYRVAKNWTWLRDWTTAAKKFTDFFLHELLMARMARTDWNFRLCCSLRSLSEGTIFGTVQKPLRAPLILSKTVVKYFNLGFLVCKMGTTPETQGLEGPDKISEHI